jgi:hypothetical protein
VEQTRAVVMWPAGLLVAEGHVLPSWFSVRLVLLSKERTWWISYNAMHMVLPFS